MDILYIVPYVPNRIRVRPFQLIRALKQLGHRVTLFTLWADDRERGDLAALRDNCHDVIALPMPRWQSFWNCLMALPGKAPLQAVYSWNPKLVHQIDSALESNPAGKFDVVHVEHLRGVHYGLNIKSRYPKIPVVWDSVDCISYLFAQASGQSRSIFSRLITQLDLGRTRNYEGNLSGNFDRVLITSPVDRQALLDLVPHKSKKPIISVIPNGVDLDYYSPGELFERKGAIVVFSGKMSYHANVTMALYLANEVMPYVWEECPEARLIIAGKDPPGNIRALGQNPAITITGTVDDIRPYLRSANVSAVPLIYGAGLQNKVLEAMACGTPVVATPGAVSALQIQAGRDVLVAQDVKDFARNILDLIEDPAYQQQVGEAGRQFVEKHHQWGIIGRKLEGIYHEVISR